jgi:uncharacterized protein (DUF427 family)
MTDTTVKRPSADHPITIEPGLSHVVVTVAGRTIADTKAALVLREAAYPPVYYIPRQDVDMTQLTRTQNRSHCPYKGDASYYSVTAGGERSKNAVWTYENPNEDVAEIKEYLAFYPNRVDAITVTATG